MVELAVRTTIILALAWGVSRLLWRAAAATRHFVWHAALIAVLAAPILSPLAPKFKVPGVPNVPGVTEVLRVPKVLRVPEVSEVPRAGITPELEAADSTQNRLGTLGTQSTSGTSGTLGTLGTLLWAMGSIALSLWFLIGWAGAAVTARRARPAPLAWQVEVDALRGRLRIARDVRVRILPGNTSPLAVGLWRSTVLLPDSAVGWDADRRGTVLLHELAHIKRGDCRVQLLAHAACALYWFNPLVWTACANLRSERERACDDEVLRGGARPSAYAAHLLDIARTLRPTWRPSIGLAMARPSELEGRLLAVLASGHARVPARSTRWVILTTLAVVTGAALGATPVGSGLAPNRLRGHATASALSVQTSDAPTPSDRLAASRTRAQASATLESSQDSRARERAVLDLAASGQADAIRPLQAALSDSSQDVREKAALGLALMSSPDVIPALLHALDDPDSQVREKAAIGLALRRDPRVVEALLGAMNDSDSQVREKVAIALGTSGDPRAAVALERALKDPDAQVREKAVSGLVLLDISASDGKQGERVRDGVRGLVGALIRLTR